MKNGNQCNSIIHIIDDEQHFRDSLQKLLGKVGNYETVSFSSGEVYIDKMKDISPPDLILIDVIMKELDGYETLKLIRLDPRFSWTPVLFVTSLISVSDRIRAFEAGAEDYITKPLNILELSSRIKTHLKLKKFNDDLQLMVEDKTRLVNETIHALVGALESANYFNDRETGEHIKRVAGFAVLIARKLKLDNDFIRRLSIYSPLHDVGKVGIPHEILAKKGPFCEAEFEKMKEHTIIGGRILNQTGIDVMAKNIALYHHEKWDGTGYPEGLSGDKIPLEARIVAPADVFDALLSERPYKKAFSFQKSIEILDHEKGMAFQPDIIKVMLSDPAELRIAAGLIQ